MANYSIKQLLSFVLACSVFFSLLTTIFRPSGTPGHVIEEASTTVFVTWAILALIYMYWRLKSALFVHCFGPLAIIALVLFEHRMYSHGAIRALTAGCLISMLIGFPTTALIILVIAFTKRFSKEPQT